MNHEPTVLCAFCDAPAVRWHSPQPIGFRVMERIPLCASKTRCGQDLVKTSPIEATNIPKNESRDDGTN